MKQPSPLDTLRWNQRYYRTWHLMEAETSLLRAWRLWRAWTKGAGGTDGRHGEN
jgi:hypothetical protein